MAKHDLGKHKPDAKREPPMVCSSEPTTEITRDEIESFGKGDSPRDTHVRAGDKSKRKPAK